MNLLEKLHNRSATIGILGLGYVGLPLMLRYADVGYRVIGFDIDEEKVKTLCHGSSYIGHISAGEIARALEQGFSPTSDFSRVAEADALIICVPTPLNRHQEPDLRYVIETVESCLPHLRPGQVVSLESTTYPGTTEEELLPRLESTGLKVGEELYLVYSPEREDPGNPDFSTSTIPKLCSGITPACLRAGVALYEQVITTVVELSSTRAAEMAKLLENIHRAVNIGLVNEMKIVADRMGIDIHEVIDAAATKPFGFVPYYPGPGLGGHCIPVDPFYLTWKAREYGVHTRFIELAGEVNSAMPEWVVGKVAEALNRERKSINGSRILILGIAYKKDVDDTRESPAVAMMALLRDRGAKVAYSDPHVARFPKMRNYRFDLESVTLSDESLASYDCCVIATDHTLFDYDQIRRHARLIVDSRGVYRGEHAQHIVRA
ncbi:MAG: nucleotide sugar dehydrogenase [Chromatiales bacterium]|nr:nucleotide sugar dehydrogenase [Chromatiales bacterium]